MGYSEQELKEARLQKRPMVTYVQAAKLLPRLDIIESLARDMLAVINGEIDKAASEIDRMMETEMSPLLSVVGRLKMTFGELTGGCRERLDFLDQSS
jgi:hypothetical protein